MTGIPPASSLVPPPSFDKKTPSSDRSSTPPSPKATKNSDPTYGSSSAPPRPQEAYPKPPSDAPPKTKPPPPMRPKKNRPKSRPIHLWEPSVWDMAKSFYDWSDPNSPPDHLPLPQSWILEHMNHNSPNQHRAQISTRDAFHN